MSQKYAERPHFYEGQYLGANDFNNLQSYLNDKQRRHALGMHSWGIVGGLELTEQEVGSDTVVHLQPGYAIDGYGRSITVLTPYQISPDLFGSESNGPVKIWLRIKEVSQAQNRTAFSACCEEDCFESIAETFVIEVGEKDWLDDRHAGVDVAGSHIIDPREITDDSGVVTSLLCDGSISYQGFPDSDDRPYWYIPIGILKWNGSKLQVRTGDQLIKSRAFRRPAGLVGENLFASNGLLRLRERTSPKKEDQTADEVCNGLAMNDRDVTLSEDGDGFTINELVWVEGDLRITGDARLFGSRLEFRKTDGDSSPPLYARRGKSNLEDIEITLGKEDASAIEKNSTRLVVGTEIDDEPEVDLEGKFFVTAAGKVGIRTGEPQDWDESANSLVIDGNGEVGLTIAGSEKSSLCFATGLEDTKVRRGRVSYDHGEDSLVLGAGDKDFVWFTSDRKLGIRTKNPSVPLHITRGNDVTLGDNTGYFQLGKTSDTNIVMDNNKIQVRKTGVASTLHLQAEGGSVEFNHWQSGKRVVVTDQGRIGIGTSTPEIPLQITNGREVDLSDNSGYLLFGKTDGRNMAFDSNEIQARNNGSASTLYLQYNGGDLKFGSGGKFHVVGSRQAGMHIVVGRITEDGNVASGTGFTSNRTSAATGDQAAQYRIDFDVNFTSPPVVIVSASDNSSWEDNIANTYDVQIDYFMVGITDGGRSSNKGENSEFNFIAIGL